MRAVCLVVRFLIGECANRIAPHPHPHSAKPPNPNEPATARHRPTTKPYNCSMCYDPATGTMFWGFVTAVIRADAIENGTDARLLGLKQQVGGCW